MASRWGLVVVVGLLAVLATGCLTPVPAPGNDDDDNDDTSPTYPGVTGLTVVAGDRAADLAWTNPAVSFQSIRIVRDGTDEVYNESAGTEYRDEQLINGTTYSYSVFVDYSADSSDPETEVVTLPEPGSLDPSFTPVVVDGNSRGLGVATRPTGSTAPWIVVAGMDDPTGSDEDIVVWAYDESGAVEATFATAGVYRDDGDTNAIANDVQIAGNDVYVVGRYENSSAGDGDDASVTRLSDVGVPIAAFGGGNGRVSIDGSQLDDSISDLVVVDNEIHLAGFRTGGGTGADASYWSLNATSGLEIEDDPDDINTQDDFVGAIALYNGTPILAGRAQPVAGNDDMSIWEFDGMNLVQQVTVAEGGRQDIDGVVVDAATNRAYFAGHVATADRGAAVWCYDLPVYTPCAGFNEGARLVFDSVGPQDEAWGIVQDADGRLLVAGTFDDDLTVWRFDVTGSLDTSFDGDGRVTLDAGVYTRAVVRGIALDELGRIVVAGYGTDGAGDHMVLFRLLP